jgi:vanillate O-demethylase monooxygenase subunit
MIEVGVAHAGKGGYDADPKDKVHSVVVDFLTPETETTMWYFWGMARNFNPRDKSLTAQIRDGQAKVFAEDTVVLEAQQRNLSLFPQRKLLMLNIDAGGVQSRRIIDRLLAEEQALAKPAAPAQPQAQAA